MNDILTCCDRSVKIVDKFDRLYMDIAYRISEMSYSKRSRVGSIIVKDDNIIAFGWNGTPKGFDNCCEDEHNNTLNEVIHAEENAICKAAYQGISLKNSTIYLTLSPCHHCARLIIQSGIKRVIYAEDYRIITSLELLKICGIEVIKLK